MKYVRSRELVESVRRLFKLGGSYRRASEKVEAVLGRVANDHPDPFEGFKLTNHGETRIRKCRKYDLPGRCRLVTGLFRIDGGDGVVWRYA